ncbi:hypothetical protein GJ744_000055 [Endocarpon pusillum]|uniref:FAD-binding PCMH-type domain-containing protein n=1 Tax=Endocarpon pusillum TaxID=364733 RepID=A0A8H7EA79_9EURO|nr:hypothetical protein GJ744_000055 [Endocarpon pusillum]
MQGGGHRPASRDFGLGADQILDSTIVLADGSIVTAEPCQNQDLFLAIRGGGGGTYSVVLSTTIKAWPTTSVVAQHLAINPLADDTSALLDVIALVWSTDPDLNDAGYSGYRTWTIASPTPLFGNFTSAFVYSISVFGKSIEGAQKVFAPVAEKLQTYNESGVEPPVGVAESLGSRLFARAALTKNHAGLRRILNTVAGAPEEYTSNAVELVSGGQVFNDSSDPYSNLHPAWRTSYCCSGLAARYRHCDKRCCA